MSIAKIITTEDIVQVWKVIRVIKPDYKMDRDIRALQAYLIRYKETDSPRWTKLEAYLANQRPTWS